MSDLISRQALLNELEHDLSYFETENKSEKEMYISVSDMRRMIKGQPTAYDVGKVVEQLGKIYKMDCFPCADTIPCNKCLNKKAIAIVKAGGVNG